MLKWLWSGKEEENDKKDDKAVKKQEKSLFQFVKHRELKANKVHFNISYVAPYLIKMFGDRGMSEEEVKSIIHKSLSGEVPYQLQNAKVFSSEEEAEKHLLNKLHDFLIQALKDNQTLASDFKQFVETKNKKFLRPNDFWIFAIEGDVKSVKDALTTEDENYEVIENTPPMPHIVYAQNNGNPPKRFTKYDIEENKGTFKR